MIETFKAGYDGIKVALDIAGGIVSLKTETAVNQAVIDIQRHVLDAQRALTASEHMHMADLKRIAELEQQLAEMKSWDAEKQRYQLKDIASCGFAYMHKPGMENGEPAMWLCQTCFEDRHKSPFQYRAQDRGMGAAGGRGSHSRWGCNRCKAELIVPYTFKPSASPA